MSQSLCFGNYTVQPHHILLWECELLATQDNQRIREFVDTFGLEELAFSNFTTRSSTFWLSCRLIIILLTDFKKVLSKELLMGALYRLRNLSVVQVEKLMSMSFVFFRFDSLIFEIE